MENINEYLATYGYIFLFFYSLGGGFFAVIAGSVLAYAGKMDIMIVFLVSVSSNFIGDIILFYMGRYNKKDILVYVKKHKRKVAYSVALVKKYGTMTIFIQKFVYGIKTIIPIAIGFSKYNFTKFIFYNFFASIIFMSFVVGLSFSSGEYILYLISLMEGYSWVYPVLLLSVLFITWKIISKASSK